jgi:hypothetical protein
MIANRDRLLWAGFTAILAAGVGFALRGGFLTTGPVSMALPASNWERSAGPVSPASVSE